MLYKNFTYFFLFFLVSNCTSISINDINKSSPKNIFTNKGFTLIYSPDLYQKKIISKKLDQRSLLIFQKNLKKNTSVKIVNINNNKSLLAKVGNNASYPLFNN